MNSPAENVTKVLSRINDGDPCAADELLPLIYAELRQLAAVRLAAESPSVTFQPTDLVHETYLRMVVQTEAQPRDRAHFIALASQAMRRILVDHARRHAAAKRPGVHGKLHLDEVPEIADEPNVKLLEMEEALCRLSKLDERQAKVVELRYFGGMTVEEAALVLGVSEATVARDWRAARAWMHRELTRS